MVIGISEAMAASGRISFYCRPHVKYDEATQNNLLYNANCPDSPCTGDDSQAYACQAWCVPSGPYAGWDGCSCPGLTIINSCILIYSATGYTQDPPGKPIVQADCHDVCTGPCGLTSAGGPSPWSVYCAACSDP
jgi:hypothetical protein